jgi:hypothetical protein
VLGGEREVVDDDVDDDVAGEVFGFEGGGVSSLRKGSMDCEGLGAWSSLSAAGVGVLMAEVMRCFLWVSSWVLSSSLIDSL